MELGLCDDKKKLMRKKIRRGLKEGDAGYLENASETDSAMEDSSSGSDDGGDESDDENDNSAQSDGEEPSNEASNESKSILEALSKDENILPALKWLKTCLDDELEDRRYVCFYINFAK